MALSKIGLIAPYDIRQERFTYFPARILFDELQTFIQEVKFIPPATMHYSVIERLRRKIIRMYCTRQGLGYRFETDRAVAAKNAAHYQEKLENENFDAIISWFTTFELAFLKHTAPLFIFRDAVFPSLLYDYDGFINLPKRSVKQGLALEQKAFDHSKAVIFSSKWGLNEYKKYYTIDHSGNPHLDYALYGPSLKTSPNYEYIKQFRFEHQKEYCRFFSPVSSGNWQRKGGDKAVEIVRRLNESEVPSRLFVCGDIPDSYKRTPDIEVLPYLNKNNPEHLKILEENYLLADFILFPTRADCTPFIIPEANAFGTPVLSTKIAGIPEMITNGVNGFLFPVDAEVDEYVEVIKRTIFDGEYYEKLRHNARLAYERVLNWHSCCEKILEIMNSTLQTPS